MSQLALQSTPETPIDPLEDRATRELSARFLAEFERAVSELAEGLRIGIAISTAAGIEQIAIRADCGCSRGIDNSSRNGRKHARIKVNLDGRSLGDVLACYEGTSEALKAVEYLIRIAARQIALENSEQALLEELSASWESLEAVYEISSDLRAIRTPCDLLERIIGRAVSVREGLQAALWLEDKAGFEMAVAKNISGLKAKRRDSGFIARAIKGKEAVVINGRSRVAEIEDCDAELEDAANIAIAPIATRQGLNGALVVWEKEDHGAFNSHSVRLFQALALQAAMVVENDRLHQSALANERLHQQLEIGSKIQQALLLGRAPKGVAKIDVGALTSASQSIDGDFYDFIEHNNNCLDVIVGDVMGKGIPAALMGAATKSEVLRAMSRSNSPLSRGWIAEPEDIIASVHGELTKQFIDLESFTTLCYARFDLDINQLQLVDCGHTRTIRYWRRLGTCGMLEGQNMPIGFSEGEVYKQFSLPIEPGDIFVFYSDGVTEARNPAGEMFGEARVADCVMRFNYLDPQHLVDRIKQEVIAFTGTEHLEDDFTCLAVRIDDDSQKPARGIRTSVTSDLRDLAHVRTFVRRACRELAGRPVDRETTAQLELGVNEAASNIMRHAYAGHSDQPICLEAELENGSLVIRLCHKGKTFDPSAVASPSFDGSRDGGFGLFIIDEMFDDVTYFTDDMGRHCTRLVKNLQIKGAI